MKNHHHIDFWLLLLAGLGLLTAILLFPKTYPYPGAQGTKSREEVLRQAEIVLDRVKFSRDGLDWAIDFHSNHSLSAFGQEKFGAAEANSLFARQLPAFYWYVQYSDTSQKKSFGEGFWEGFRQGFEGKAQEKDPFEAAPPKEHPEHPEHPIEHPIEHPTAENTAEVIEEKNLVNEAGLAFDIHGRLLWLELSYATSPDTLSLSWEEAKSLIFSLTPFSPFRDADIVLESARVNGKKKSVDYKMTWWAPSPVDSLKTQLQTEIQGTRLRQWRLEYVPITATRHKNTFLALGPKIFAWLLIVVLASIFLIKKLRADEISLKAGLPAAVAAAVGLGLSSLANATIDSKLLLGIIFLAGFITLGFVILYATGESLMRTTRHNRLLSFEAAQRGRWWFRPVGESLWRGAALGLILFGVVTLILNRFGPLFKTHLDALPLYAESTALFTGAGENLCFTLFGETAYRLFLISALAQFIRKTWAIVGIAAIVSAMGQTHLVDFSSFGFSFGINFLIGLALTLIYLRFDFLTAVIAAFMLPLLLPGFGFFYLGKVASPLNGFIILALPLLFVAGGQFIRRFGRTEIDTRALQSDYLQRLAEKERQQHELEIARQVQHSFLPKQIPSINGLDIAALTMPANEVGGDYYDFVQFDHQRLGVLIGDVSGKGISAAFYMTFTKGIFQSLLQEESPAARSDRAPYLALNKVLTQANELFYDHAKRGVFVSLIYGVFDVQNRWFTFARAGHVPILLISPMQKTVRFIEPKGLALGLKSGEVFSAALAEQTLALANGDVLVFYTDGFTEAMNRYHDEFGESRWLEILSPEAELSSQETITRLLGAVQTFAGNAPQHDDMTIVAVRVL